MSYTRTPWKLIDQDFPLEVFDRVAYLSYDPLKVETSSEDDVEAAEGNPIGCVNDVGLCAHLIASSDLCHQPGTVLACKGCRYQHS